MTPPNDRNRPADNIDHIDDSGEANAQARVFGRYVDDLLSEREPALLQGAAAAFAPAELAETLSTARFVKAVLRPGSPSAPFVEALRGSLVERVRTQRALAVAASPTLADLIASRRAAAGLSVPTLAAAATVDEAELAGLETDTAPWLDIAPERLARLGRALAVSAQDLLTAAQRSAQAWLERLVQQRLQTERTMMFGLDRSGGLDGRPGTPGTSASDTEAEVRREEAERLAAYLLRLEELAQWLDQPHDPHGGDSEGEPI